MDALPLSHQVMPQGFLQNLKWIELPLHYIFSLSALYNAFLFLGPQNLCKHWHAILEWIKYNTKILKIESQSYLISR